MKALIEQGDEKSDIGDKLQQIETYMRQYGDVPAFQKHVGEARYWRDWLKFDEKGTIDAYELFIQRYEDGTKRAVALERLRCLKDWKIYESSCGSTLKEIRAFLKRYPNNCYRSNAVLKGKKLLYLETLSAEVEERFAGLALEVALDALRNAGGGSSQPGPVLAPDVRYMDEQDAFQGTYEVRVKCGQHSECRMWYRLTIGLTESTCELLERGNGASATGACQVGAQLLSALRPLQAPLRKLAQFGM